MLLSRQLRPFRPINFHRFHSSSSSEIYFGVNSLNRHSFLRTDASFVANSITSPYANYIFFENSNPIVDVKKNTLFKLNYETIGSPNRSLIDDWIHNNSSNSIKLLDSPRIHFLGLDTTSFSPFKYKDKYSGVPYYAIEIQNHESFKSKIYQNTNVELLTTREIVNKHLNYFESNVFAQAKMYLDWISTTTHCRGCGSKTIPINAGSELKCSSKDDVQCPIKSSPVSNASFPRLDPVLISSVINHDRTKVLLTRLPKFPRGMYTHIAGFIEPGETVENAVRREVWEESGLRVDTVDIVRTQPWPYPSNIMIGCVATVANENELDLENDLELQDAFWCDISIIKEIVYDGVEDENLTLLNPKYDYGIPNDKTLATKLFQYIADTY